VPGLRNVQPDKNFAILSHGSSPALRIGSPRASNPRWRSMGRATPSWDGHAVLRLEVLAEARLESVTQIERDRVMNFNVHDRVSSSISRRPASHCGRTIRIALLSLRSSKAGPLPGIHGVVRERIVDLC
jgi:hypothetical protein